MYKSHLRKMRVELNNPVDYWLPVEDGEVYMNDLIGRKSNCHLQEKLIAVFAIA